jgi:hypothetical protein
VIVHEHLAALREAREREDTLHVATRRDPRGAYDAIVIERADEAHFPAAGEPDSGPHGGGGS